MSGAGSYDQDRADNPTRSLHVENGLYHGTRAARADASRSGVAGVQPRGARLYLYIEMVP
jgi:hypothetical protein